jgi:large subunit ribosomal protein L7Ae
VNKEDKSKSDSLCAAFRSQFNNNVEPLRKWGGGIMGLKTQKRLEIRAKVVAAEEAKKAQY